MLSIDSSLLPCPVDPIPMQTYKYSEQGKEAAIKLASKQKYHSPSAPLLICVKKWTLNYYSYFFRPDPWHSVFQINQWLRSILIDHLSLVKFPQLTGVVRLAGLNDRMSGWVDPGPYKNLSAHDLKLSMKTYLKGDYILLELINALWSHFPSIQIRNLYCLSFLGQGQLSAVTLTSLYKVRLKLPAP